MLLHIPLFLVSTKTGIEQEIEYWSVKIILSYVTVGFTFLKQRDKSH